MVTDAFHFVHLTQDKPACDQKYYLKSFLKLLKGASMIFLLWFVELGLNFDSIAPVAITLCVKTTDLLFFCVWHLISSVNVVTVCVDVKVLYLACGSWLSVLRFSLLSVVLC